MKLNLSTEKIVILQSYRVVVVDGIVEIVKKLAGCVVVDFLRKVSRKNKQILKPHYALAKFLNQVIEVLGQQRVPSFTASILSNSSIDKACVASTDFKCAEVLTNFRSDSSLN